MSNFGELVLVLGDLHIPQRASKIPAPFKRMLVPNKMAHVICTGNVSAEQYEELRGLAPNVHVVAGDFDDCESSASGGGGGGVLTFPETRVLQVGAFRIGVIHGHQILPWSNRDSIERMRRRMNVDILVTGHSHQNEVHVEDGAYHINPGSITGAYSSLTDKVTPSFILLAVQDKKVVCYVYELVNGEVDVSKTEFTKKEPTGSDASVINASLMASLLT